MFGRSKNFMKLKIGTVTVLKNTKKEKSKNHRKAAHTRRQRGFIERQLTQGGREDIIGKTP
jgi:hypothetical protein